MNKKLVNIFKYLIFVALAAGLLYFLFSNVDREATMAALKRANYMWAIAGMLCGYLAFVFRGLRWKLFLKPMGYTPGSWNSIHAVSIGYFANYLPVPRLGEVVRCTAMSGAEKIPVDKLFGTVLAERVIDLIMLATCFFTVLSLKFSLVTDILSKPSATPQAEGHSLFFWVLVVGAIAVVLFAIIVWRFWSKLITMPFVPKVIEFFKGIGVGFKTVLHLDKRGLFIVYTLLIWLMYFFMCYLYFFCLKETSHLTPADGLFVMIAGSIGVMAPVPGGFGAFHAAAMGGLMALGIRQEIAFSMAVIVHTSQLLMTWFSGGLALILLYLGRKKRKDAVLQQEI